MVSDFHSFTVSSSPTTLADHATVESNVVEMDDDDCDDDDATVISGGVPKRSSRASTRNATRLVHSSSFYRLDDRFSRCMNACDTLMLRELRRQRQVEPIVICEDDEDERAPRIQTRLLPVVPTNPLIKLNLTSTGGMERRIVPLGGSGSKSNKSGAPSFVVQHVRRGSSPQQPQLPPQVQRITRGVPAQTSQVQQSQARRGSTRPPQMPKKQQQQREYFC